MLRVEREVLERFLWRMETAVLLLTLGAFGVCFFPWAIVTNVDPGGPLVLGTCVIGIAVSLILLIRGVYLARSAVRIR